MPSSADFWDQRARQYGHTGYADRALYAYDQLARLRAVQHVLTGIQPAPRAALDFGAGSGDFARLLAERTTRVIAFDISAEVLRRARARHRDCPRIEFRQRGSVQELGLAEGILDLVLSVTALGHILDETELCATLAFLRTRLRPGGLLLAFEYTPATARPASPYQAFRPLPVWCEALAAAGLALERCDGFYHPVEAPCPSYTRYAARPVVRFARRRPLRWIAGPVCDWIAHQVLRNTLDFLWPGERCAPMTIMTARAR